VLADEITQRHLAHPVGRLLEAMKRRMCRMDADATCLGSGPPFFVLGERRTPTSSRHSTRCPRKASFDRFSPLIRLRARYLG